MMHGTTNIKKTPKIYFSDRFTEKDKISRYSTNLKQFENHWVQKFDALKCPPSERHGSFRELNSDYVVVQQVA